jgi:hypothetical protein
VSLSAEASHSRPIVVSVFAPKRRFVGAVGGSASPGCEGPPGVVMGVAVEPAGVVAVGVPVGVAVEPAGAVGVLDGALVGVAVGVSGLLGLPLERMIGKKIVARAITEARFAALAIAGAGRLMLASDGAAALAARGWRLAALGGGRLPAIRPQISSRLISLGRRRPK